MSLNNSLVWLRERGSQARDEYANRTFGSKMSSVLSPGQPWDGRRADAGKKFSPSLSIDRGTQEDLSCAKMWPKALSPMEKIMHDLRESSPKSQVSYPG